MTFVVNMRHGMLDLDLELDLDLDLDPRKLCKSSKEAFQIVE